MTQSQATQRKGGADFTGRQGEKLAAEKRDRVKEAAERMAISTAVEAEVKNTIIDLVDPENPIAEVEVRKVEVNSPYRIIRTNTTLSQVTYGRKVLDQGHWDQNDPSKNRPPIMGPMNVYNLEEGQPYKVPKEFAEHLNDKGYLSYMGGV